MALYVAAFVDPLNLGNPLPEADERDLREALRLMRRFLDDYAPYVTLLRNHMELDAELNRIDQEFRNNPPGYRGAHQIDVMMLEANRLMMNFLASARSFLNIVPQRLRVFAPNTADRFTAWCSVQYDDSVSYRIFENLRNVSQHRDLPIRAYSALQRRRDDGTIEVSQELMIDRETFIESDIQAPVRVELAGWQGNIPVRGHLMRYFEGLGHVQLLVFRDIIAPYKVAADLIRRHLRVVGDPAVVPIFFFEQDAIAANRIELDLIDPHLHAAVLIDGADAMAQATDFTQLDRLSHAHRRWPG